MKFFYVYLLYLICSIAGAAEHGKVFSPLPLPKNDFQFEITEAKVIDNTGQVCMVGGHFDPEETIRFGRILLVDVEKRKILWDKVIKPDENDNKINFIDCIKHGNYIYVVGNSNVSNFNLTRTRVLKLDLQGNVLSSKVMDIPAEHLFARRMGVVDGQLYVAGAMQETDKKLEEESYSVFLAKFDDALTFLPKIIRKGGFQNESAMRILKNGLYIGGVFFPGKAKINDVVNNFYANSRISLNANYIWSVRPQVTKFASIATEISDSGDIFSLANEENKSYLGMVSHGGEIVFKGELHSQYCQTRQLILNQDILYAIRAPCEKRNTKDVLVALDVNSRKEQKVANIKNEPVRIFFIGTDMYIIAKDAKNNLAIERN